jgi:UDP-N-acetylglucosamine 1-carboxyvinyltransferase
MKKDKEYLIIEGGHRLAGEVQVAGSKNAALPLLIATLLTAARCKISNVPNLDDISSTLRLLESLGASVRRSAKTVEIFTPNILTTDVPQALTKSTRASFWVLGPLLARAGEVRVSLPGGDSIGNRPVNLHLEGLDSLGAEISIRHGVVHAVAPGGLHGGVVEFDFPSVGATHQILMAAALIPEEVVIKGAAREPEVVALAEFLSSMGVKIEGAGSNEIRVRGKEILGEGEVEVIGDRIEAVTYLLAGAMTGGEVSVSGIQPAMIESSLQVMRETGCEIREENYSVTLVPPERLKAVSCETAPFPGLATDVQPLMMAAMTIADGRSEILEKIFESRFGHVLQYRKFSAKITLQGHRAMIEGSSALSAASVDGGDIRAAAGLVLLALVATGHSEIYEIHHLDRGYEGLVEKLRILGAQIKRIPAYDGRELVLGC